jgi:hypothetical protein
VNVYEGMYRIVLDDGHEYRVDHEDVSVLPDRVRSAVDAVWWRFRARPLSAHPDAAQPERRGLQEG